VHHFVNEEHQQFPCTKPVQNNPLPSLVVPCWCTYASKLAVITIIQQLTYGSMLAMILA